MRASRQHFCARFCRHPGQPIGDKLRAQGKARSRVTREQDHVIAQLRSRLATAIGSMDGAVQKAFRASDLDKDNSISEPELKEMLQTLKVRNPHFFDLKWMG